jgi:8-oxo-dGTP diphosphatase
MTQPEGPVTVIRIAAAVVVDGHDRLLVVRKRGTSAFMQPGGKIEPGETTFAAMRREVLEELGVDVVVASARALGRFHAPAANEPRHVVEADLFAVELTGVPLPGAEIEELAWIDHRRSPTVDLAPLTKTAVFDYLRSAGPVTRG